MTLRLAPGLSGLLHVGQARVALANWLVARRHDETVVLRLDDVDGGRVRAGAAAEVEQDLRWLGLDWDVCVSQSERAGAYAAAALRLEAAGRVYACFEGEEELQFKREQRVKQGRSPIYDRAMLKMTAGQRARAEAGGKRPYFRFLLSGVAAEWGDMVLGRQAVKLSALSDPVVMRADGVPAPLFAAAVDELELGVSHVVREADQVTATGMQIDVMAALGGRANTVRFGHLPTLEGERGEGEAERAGRRRALPSLRSLRADGVTASALVGFLAGADGGGGGAPVEAAALARGYDLSRVSRAGRVFDPAGLLAANRAALAGLPFEAVRERLPPAATPAFWAAVRGSLDLVREARGWWEVVAGTIIPPVIAGEAGFLERALAALPPEPWGDGVWEAWVGALADEGEVADREGVLRLALTGEEEGPALAELLPLMGRGRVVERLGLAAS